MLNKVSRQQQVQLLLEVHLLMLGTPMMDPRYANRANTMTKQGIPVGIHFVEVFFETDLFFIFKLAHANLNHHLNQFHLRGGRL